MKTYYQIAGWDNNYEVDSEGQDWVPGKSFCQEPLEYIRFSVARMQAIDLGGLDGLRALGLFRLLAEIVACRPRPLREGGLIRNDEGGPATVEEIAQMLHVEAATVQEGLRLLTRPDVALLEEVVTPTEVHG